MHAEHHHLLYIVIAFLLLVIAALLAFIARKIPVNAIPNWREAYRFLSVQLVVVAGGMDALALWLQSASDQLSQLGAVAQIQAITSTTEYHTVAMCVTFAAGLARIWQQRPRGATAQAPK